MISNRSHVFTSESVTEGHPDKMADQISDAILDSFLEQDENARIAVECLLKTGLCLIAGEISSHAQVNLAKIARSKISQIGYDNADFGFNSQNCAVLCAIDEQSPDIARGVDALGAKELGAGDQGMMFGFACNETKEYMPLPITYAHMLAERLAYVRKNNVVPFLGPDGKTQVTVRYVEGQPIGVEEIVISSQHLEGIAQETIREALIEEVINKTIKKEHLRPGIKFHINPTGSFVVGGPNGDTGLTGRKIIVDTYGGMGRHGGGAFSGKDPSKVDRSAAYMARYIAKNVVAAGLARCCEVQLAYAIGVSEPVSVMVNTFGSAVIDEEKIENAIKSSVSLTPAAIIKTLDLRRPIYANTASYGHFGRSKLMFAWEKLDLVEDLKARLL